MQKWGAEMYLVAIGWMFVVVCMAGAEAMSPVGSLLGAFFTLLLYGVLPLSVVLYVMGAPGRRRARKAAEAAELSAAPDGGGHAAGDAVAAERKEP
jgi:membrane protein implicated in regulation of membrane protease activity